MSRFRVAACTRGAYGLNVNARFELHFTEPSGDSAKLARTIFKHAVAGGNAAPLQSEMFGNHEPGKSSSNGFQWREGVMGLAVLFLRSEAARRRAETRFIFRRQDSEFAKSILGGVRRADAWFKNAWLPKMFAAQGFDDRLWQTLFDEDDQTGWVALSDKWREGEISVFLNGNRLNAAAELDALADRIEGKEPPPPLRASLDLLIKSRQGPGFICLDPQSPLLPVRSDDTLQVQVRLNPPAFVCVAWLDRKGMPLPLHPWDWTKNTEPSTWEVCVKTWNQPIAWETCDGFDMPDLSAGGEPFDLKPDEVAGFQTLVLMASRTRPSSDLTAGLPKLLNQSLTGRGSDALRNYAKTEFQEQGRQVVRGFPRPVPTTDPIRKLHAALNAKLRPPFDSVVALSFANSGTTFRAKSHRTGK